MDIDTVDTQCAVLIFSLFLIHLGALKFTQMNIYALKCSFKKSFLGLLLVECFHFIQVPIGWTLMRERISFVRQKQTLYASSFIINVHPMVTDF